INESPFDDHAKTEQLKWLLLFQLKLADLQLANQLEHIPFIEGKRFDVITFVCDGLHWLAKRDAAMREKINAVLRDAPFLDYILRYISFQPDVESNLERLLHFDLTEQHEITLRSKLA